jgi:hypothetical protein
VSHLDTLNRLRRHQWVRFVLGLAVFGVLPSAAQATVYLRSGTPGDVRHVVNAVPGPNRTIRLTVSEPHGWQSGDRINVDGVGGCWRVNGTRLIHTVVDNTTVDLHGRNGEPLDCGDTYRPPGSTGSKYYFAAKLTPYRLKPPPNVMGFDGPDGEFLRALRRRATPGNPGYAATKNVVDGYRTRYTTVPWASYTGWLAAGAALLWQAAGRPVCPDNNVVTNPNGTKRCSSSEAWVYLDMARWWANNAELIFYSPGCDEELTSCGRAGLTNAIDQDAPDMQSFPRAYSLIYDQLTPGEKQAFADKFLNNVATNNSDETPCRNPYVRGKGTLTAAGGNNIVQLSDTSEAAKLGPGDNLVWRVGGSIADMYFVARANTATGQVTVDRTVSASHSAQRAVWHYAKPWTKDQCGHVWFMGHFGYNSLWTRDSHPPSGGNVYSYQQNLVWAKNTYYGIIGAATCAQDVRGCELFERAQAFFYDRMYLIAKHMFTGLTAAGSGTYRGRVDGHAGDWTMMLKHGLDPPLDISGGVWLRRNLLQTIYANLPTSGSHFHSWGDTSQREQYMYQMYQSLVIPAAVAGTEEAASFLHFLFHRYPYNSQSLAGATGKLAPSAFMYVDPDAPRSNYTLLPPQYLFQQTDLDDPPQQYTSAYSKTGWGPNDTSILMYFLGSWQDHATFKAPGSYQIFKGNYLYADDRGASIAACMTASCFSSEGSASSAVEIGEPSLATATSHNSWQSGLFDPVLPLQGSYMEVKRWAGVNPTGRPENDYTYVAYDAASAGNQATTGTRLLYQWYQYLHLKSGGRDYLFRHVDTALNSPKLMRTALHFPNNAGPQVKEGYTTMDGEGWIFTTTDSGTSMHTKVLWPPNPDRTTTGVIRGADDTLVINFAASPGQRHVHRSGGMNCTFEAPARVRLSANSASGTAYLYIKPDCRIVVGHNGLSLAELTGVQEEQGITEYPKGVYRLISWASAGNGQWASSGYIRGGQPNMGQNSYRALVDLGSGTESEFLVVHDIHATQEATAAPVRLLESPPGWHTIQVDGSLPAVVAISRKASCYQDWAVQSDHPLLGQYVIAGLCPGTYQISHNEAVLRTIEVAAGDETAAWAGAAGQYRITLLAAAAGASRPRTPSGKRIEPLLSDSVAKGAELCPGCSAGGAGLRSPTRGKPVEAKGKSLRRR